MYPQQYIQFMNSFNILQEYYLCHDLLEDLWLEEGRDPFYQGLLQVAVSFYHANNGNISGAYKMMQNALRKLRLYPDEWMGINLQQVVRDAEHYLDQLLLQNSKPFQIVILDPTLTSLVEQVQLD